MTAGNLREALIQALEDMKDSWEGDDYDSVVKAMKDQLTSFEEAMKSLENGFELLETAAQVYNSFQDRCIEEFQAAAN